MNHWTGFRGTLKQDNPIYLVVKTHGFRLRFCQQNQFDEFRLPFWIVSYIILIIVSLFWDKSPCSWVKSSFSNLSYRWILLGALVSCEAFVIDKAQYLAMFLLRIACRVARVSVDRWPTRGHVNLDPKIAGIYPLEI